MFKLVLIFLLTFRIELIFASLPLVINTWNFQSSTVKGTCTLNLELVSMFGIYSTRTISMGNCIHE